jgi:lysophospholipase L1-like esterase
MNHVGLLGDSIFDNGAYVRPGEPDVVRQLQSQLRDGWRASLRAVDGSVVRGVERQLAGAPTDASHLVVSSGGNDALGRASILSERAGSVAEVLARLARIGDEFERDYRQMLKALLARRLPCAVCTIYYPQFPEAELQKLTTTALTVFNEVIIRQAFAHGLPLIDLRLVCNEPSDYANPIEPSARGGEKIAATIARLLREHDFTRRRTEVFIA